MDLMTAITGIPGVGPALPYLLAIVAICSALAPFLSAPKSQTGAYAAFYGVVNFIALNMGHARNATAPSQSVMSGPSKPVLAVLLAGVLAALSACTAAQQLQAVTIAVNALPCYNAIAAEVQTGSNATKALTAAQVAAMNPACAAVDQASLTLIASALNTGTPVQPGAVPQVAAVRAPGR